MENQQPPGADTLKELLDSFEKLTEDQQKTQRDDLRFLLQRRIEGIHYAETRRNGIATLATGVFAAGIALIATTANITQISPSVGLALMFLSLGFVISSVITWVVFVRQINPKYPFLSATENKKWFYHGALPAKVTLASYKSLQGTFTSKEFEARRVEEFDQKVPAFYSLTREWLLDARGSLEADIKQLHSLHSNECVKNAQLTLIRSVFVWTVGCSLCIAFITFLYSSILKGKQSASLRQTSIARKSTLTGKQIRKYVLEGGGAKSGAFSVETLSGQQVDFTIGGFLTESDQLAVWVPENIASKHENLRIRL